MPHQSFLGILYYTLFSIIIRIGFENRKLTHFLPFCREIDFDSNNTVPLASAKVVTPIVVQVSVMPTSLLISISPREKPKKFNGL